MINLNELIELDILKTLNPKSLELLANFGEKKSFSKNTNIFIEREYSNEILLTKKGKVALYKLNEYGHKKIVFILGSETFINEAQLDNLKSSINCEAFENCEILSFEKDKFKEIMMIDFNLTNIIINSLAKKNRRMYRQLKNSTSINVKKKLAAKLWKFSNDYGIEIAEGTLIDLTMSVTYLSEMFGIPRETISRALKFLMENNLIIQKNKQIIVINKDRLAAYFKGTLKEFS
ncbi:MAG: Crp/Fnr family transcriptional regulator [Sarcina sp.]